MSHYLREPLLAALRDTRDGFDDFEARYQARMNAPGGPSSITLEMKAQRAQLMMLGGLVATLGVIASVLVDMDEEERGDKDEQRPQPE